MAMPPVVSADEWQKARDELLIAEKEAARAQDAPEGWPQHPTHG